MKSGLNKKAFALLCVMALMLFPFRIFCEDEAKHAGLTQTIDAYDSHSDCPFCSFDFYNDIEHNETLHLNLLPFQTSEPDFTFSEQTVSTVILTGNKGPPSTF